MMKSLLLDKSVLQGAKAAYLKALSEEYYLLLPGVLLYEVLTEDSSKTTKTPWRDNLRKLEGLRVYVCHWPFSLMLAEKELGKPVLDIINWDATFRWRAELLQPCETWVLPDMERMKVDIEQGIPRKLRIILDSMRSGKIGDRRGFRETVEDRFRGDVCKAVVEQVQQDKFIHSVLDFADPHARPKDFSMATRWVYFCFYTLLTDLAVQYWYNGTKSSEISDHSIANNHLDILYAVYLGHADGIATGDKALQRRVRAFFPNKLVLGTPEGQSDGDAT